MAHFPGSHQLLVLLSFLPQEISLFLLSGQHRNTSLHLFRKIVKRTAWMLVSGREGEISLQIAEPFKILKTSATMGQKLVALQVAD